MGNPNEEIGKTDDSSDGFANLIWDEYKYRHEHIWNTVFKLTGSVVLLLIIPYTHRRVTCVLGDWILISPLLAMALYGFGVVRLGREFAVFNLIKTKHRDLQKKNSRILHVTHRWTFKNHVNFYLAGLGLVTLVNTALLNWLWIPAISGLECFSDL